MRIIAMIPARYRATRFPRKLMKDLNGKPIIVRTFEATKNTNLFDEVYVVTDSQEIKNEIEWVNGKVFMSKRVHDCGSDRIAEAVKNIDTDIVINVQGDEPFIDQVSLGKLIGVFKEDKDGAIDLASLKVELREKEDIENQNHVKVITDVNDFAMYFSRLPIPFLRNKELKIKYYKHIGVYAFRKQALIDFYHTEKTPLELAESIEGIRYLEVGKKIKMIETKTQTIGIDTPEDLENARQILKNV